MGRVWAEAHADLGMVRQEYRILIVRRHGGTLDPEDPGSRTVSVPIRVLEDGDVEIFPRDLGLFLRGFLEGWIPDGLITLGI